MVMLNLPQIAENQAGAHISSNDADGALEQALCGSKLDYDATSGSITVATSDFQQNWFHKIAGTPSADFNVSVPAILKPFVLQNSTTKIAKLLVGNGPIFGLLPGQVRLFYCDGVKVIAHSDLISGSSAGAPPIQPAFSGALIGLNANIPVSNSSSANAISWGNAHYDIGGFFDAVAHPTRFSIPAGVSKIILKGQLSWSNSGSGFRELYFNKNGSHPYAGFTRNKSASYSYTVNATTSPVLNVATGDYFEMVAATNGSGISILNNDASWFSLEVIG
jgi:hypothetical protein